MMMDDDPIADLRLHRRTIATRQYYGHQRNNNYYPKRNTVSPTLSQTDLLSSSSTPPPLNNDDALAQSIENIFLANQNWQHTTTTTNNNHHQAGVGGTTNDHTKWNAKMQYKTTITGIQYQRKQRKGWLAHAWQHLASLFCFNRVIPIEAPFPQSLQLIVNFYRCTGLSFSGCFFVHSPSSSSLSSEKKPNESIQKSTKISRHSFWIAPSSPTGDGDVYEDSHSNKPLIIDSGGNGYIWLRSLVLLANILTILLNTIPLCYSPFRSTFYRKPKTNSTEVNGLVFSNDYCTFLNQIWRTLQQLLGTTSTTENSTTNTDDELDIGNSNDNGLTDDLNQLKPILRLIMQWLMYVYVLNELFASIYNLLFGGALLKLLLSVPEFFHIDRDRKLAYKFLSICVIACYVMRAIGMWLYEGKLIVDVIVGDPPSANAVAAAVSGDEENNSMPQWPTHRLFAALNLLIEFIWSPLNFLLLTYQSTLFIYTMYMFSGSIDHLTNELVTTIQSSAKEKKQATITSNSSSNVQLDELTLSTLKHRLSELNARFKHVLAYFATPLTMDFVANTYMLIGSACFLIVNQDRTNIHSFAIVFIFNLGLFAFVRLVLVAAVGNSPSNSCTKLCRLIYEHKEEWSMYEWMHYLEIKRMPELFRVSIGGIYSVQQSSILTMLGFALNYIVILLQTENYSNVNSNNSTNSNDTALKLTNTTSRN